MATFQEFHLQDEVIRGIFSMGFEEATPVQTETIPLALGGVDLIGQAQTGTGKTAAFGIPLIEKISVQKPYIQGLVLAPTRELAIQVSEELNKIGHFKGVYTLPIYGGQDINRQIKALNKRPHIIVGTPGRLMDHLRRRTIRLQQIEIVVLDEADEMLSMGFVDDIETILDETPGQRQTLLFSATMPGPIRSLAEKFMKNPTLIKVKTKEMTTPNIQQSYMEVAELQKFEALTRMLDLDAPELAIVFGRTKRRVDELAEALHKRGYSAEGIHGDLSQAKRDNVIRQFKEGTIEVLVATDVAARGLDVSGVTHVYNFDIPQDAESYVHRVGRTGRAGKTGEALTFVTPRERNHLKMIEQSTKRKISRQSVPTVAEANQGLERQTVKKLYDVINEGTEKRFKELAGELLQETDSQTLLAAALSLITKTTETKQVVLSGEKPFRSEHKKTPHKKNKNFRVGRSKGNNGN